MHIQSAATDFSYPSTRLSPVAGVLAGLVAGAAYLAAQMSFAATIHGGAAGAPLQRIAAILLGPDAVDPGEALSVAVIGMALLIHFALAAVYGRLIDWTVRGRGGLEAIGRGAALGLVVYLIDYWLLAPIAFQWFDEARGLTTVADHLLFGAVAAAAYVQLRRKLTA
jgi:type IV secretory pathway VirB2 component (pilin)